MFTINMIFTSSVENVLNFEFDFLNSHSVHLFQYLARNMRQRHHRLSLFWTPLAKTMHGIFYLMTVMVSKSTSNIQDLWLTSQTIDRYIQQEKYSNWLAAWVRSWRGANFIWRFYRVRHQTADTELWWGDWYHCAETSTHSRYTHREENILVHGR